MRQKVESHPDLERDVHSKAIVNTDNQAFHAHKQRRKAAINQKKKMAEMEQTIEGLTNSVTQLNSLVEKLLTNLEKN